MRSECACLRLTLSHGVFNGIVNYLGKRKRRATLATWSRTTGKCATDLVGLVVRQAPVKKWFRQPESNQHPVVRSHEFYPLDYGGMKSCPFQLGTGWRQTGAAPTLLPLGVDNTVVGSLQAPPRWGGLPVPYSFAVNCKLLCDHQNALESHFASERRRFDFTRHSESI